MNTDKKRSENGLNPFALSKAVLIIWYKAFLNEAVKFVLAFIQHSKAAQKVLRDSAL